MEAAHPVFTTDLRPIWDEAIIAAKDAIKHVINERWQPDIDVEHLYEWKTDGNFSKSGATLEFKVTVYLTPLETNEL